jgi:Ulp1 family protease
LRFDHELASWGTEDHIHDIGNSTDKEYDRLPLYKENLAKLKNGQWLGNSIIDFFIWKHFDMLNKLGIKDEYTHFKIMDSCFMYYMYLTNQRYNFN